MISIIIPVFNTRIDYFKECINSVLNISQDYEAIIINDGSSIDYSDFLPSQSNFKYIVTNNFGVSHARNIGINFASGEKIFFLDSDDILIPSIFEKINKMVNYDIIITRNYIQESNERRFEPIDTAKSFEIETKSILFDSVYSRNSSFASTDTSWGILFDRQFLIKNNIFFEEELLNYEDIIFNLKAFLNSMKIFYYNDFSYIYRINETSACNRLINNFDDISIIFLSHLKKFIIDNNHNITYYNNYLFRIIIRLFRKYYINCDGFEEFYQMISKFIEDDEYINSLGSINRFPLTDNQLKILDLLLNKDVTSLYMCAKDSNFTKRLGKFY